MKCSKCGAKIEKDDDFCSECGTKFEHKTIEHKDIPLKNILIEQKIEEQDSGPVRNNSLEHFKLSKKTGMIFLLITVLIIILFISVFVIKYPHKYIEAYSDSESYQEQECADKVPMIITAYDSSWSGGSNGQGVNTLYCNVTNKENAVIRVNVTMYVGCMKLDLKNFTSGPQTIKRFGQYSYTNSEFVPGSCSFSCTFDADKVTVCSMVTKWRDIPKTRILTRYESLINIKHN